MRYEILIAGVFLGLLQGCAFVQRVQCGAARLPDSKVIEIAYEELDRRGFKSHRGAVDTSVGFKNCGYYVLTIYLPQKYPGGHVGVVVDQYGQAKEVVPGR